MAELRYLREVAAALHSGPSFEAINQFVIDFDADKIDPKKPADADRVLYFESACRHIRGYADLYVEGFTIGQWDRLLEKAAKELRKTFASLDFPVH